MHGPSKTRYTSKVVTNFFYTLLSSFSHLNLIVEIIPNRKFAKMNISHFVLPQMIFSKTSSSSQLSAPFDINQRNDFASKSVFLFLFHFFPQKVLFTGFQNGSDFQIFEKQIFLP
jgi:hypothetical protein